jgi:hypothetical protein
LLLPMTFIICLTCLDMLEEIGEDHVSQFHRTEFNVIVAHLIEIFKKLWVLIIGIGKI